MLLDFHPVVRYSGETGPPRTDLEEVIGAALIDAEFRENLLRAPATAVADFNLSEEELDVLNSADADSLEDLAAHVYAWITRAPKPRRGATLRWAPDSPQAAQVAV